MRPHPIVAATPDLGAALVNGYAWANVGGYANCWQFANLRVIADQQEGWQHVSVSCADRCPTWVEMEFVKRCFFYTNECAMQLHVPEAEHINCHPYCLHIWAPPHGTVIPRPPGWLVGAS